MRKSLKFAQAILEDSKKTQFSQELLEDIEHNAIEIKENLSSRIFQDYSDQYICKLAGMVAALARNQMHNQKQPASEPQKVWVVREFESGRIRGIYSTHEKAITSWGNHGVFYNSEYEVQ